MQATVSLSSAKAEYIVLRSITQEVLFRRQIPKELLGEEHKKISIIYEDNLGVIYLTIK